MKKSILIFALAMFTAFVYGQDIKLTKKKEKALSNYEIKINRDTWILPAVKLNYYFNESTILHVDGPNLSRKWMRDVKNNTYNVGLFLEKRKYIKSDKIYMTHGPAASMTYNGNKEINKSTFRAGYNLGIGTRVNRHFTVGTYLNPYVSVNSSGDINILHGRIAVGGISNAYIAYRF